MVGAHGLWLGPALSPVEVAFNHAQDLATTQPQKIKAKTALVIPMGRWIATRNLVQV